MEHKYALFVACATLAAHTQLQVLLAKYRCSVTPEILQDASRFGIQAALQRLFPGLIRLPFGCDPFPEVVLALRYEYEEDPEKTGAQAPAGKGGTSSVGTGPSSSRWKVSGGSRLPERLVPAPAPVALPPRPSASAPQGEESSRGYPFSAPPTAEPRTSPTNLQKISSAPIFPWEKGKA